MPEFKVSQEAWVLLREFTKRGGDTLAGENQARNEDGTFTIELDDDFYAALKRKMLIGETVEGFILRCLKKQPN